MKRVQLSASAELDLNGIWQYVVAQSENTEIADKVLDGIGRHLVLLGHTPLAGRRRDDIRPGMRSFAAGSYMIYYRVRNGRALISRIIHGSREQATAFSEEPGS